MNCRHCSAKLENSFVDLAFSPPSNAYLSFDQLSHAEQYFPLKVAVCRSAGWFRQLIFVVGMTFYRGLRIFFQFVSFVVGACRALFRFDC